MSHDSPKILTPNFKAKKSETPTSQPEKSESGKVIVFHRSPPELDCFIPVMEHMKTKEYRDWIGHLRASAEQKALQEFQARQEQKRRESSPKSD